MRKSRIATVVTGLFTAMTIFFFCQIAHGDQGLALIQAAGENDLTQVQNLLEKGTDVNAKNNEGVTPLMMGSVMGHVEVVKRLLERGADVNAKAGTGSVALMLASIMGHLDAARQLLEKGADVSIKSKDGDTALMAAAAKGHTKIVELLIAHGAKE